MRDTDKQLLEANGWTVECESPFEIRHTEGCFATGQAAIIVLASCRPSQELDITLDEAVGLNFLISMGYGSTCFVMSPSSVDDERTFRNAVKAKQKFSKWVIARQEAEASDPD